MTELDSMRAALADRLAAAIRHRRRAEVLQHDADEASDSADDLEEQAAELSRQLRVLEAATGDQADFERLLEMAACRKAPAQMWLPVR